MTVEKRKVGGKGDVFFVVRVEKVLTEWEKKELEIGKWVGFRKVMDVLWEGKKPVIAHNCFTDFLFLHESFIGSLAGKSYQDFKRNMYEKMPLMYDTKVWFFVFCFFVFCFCFCFYFIFFHFLSFPFIFFHFIHSISLSLLSPLLHFINPFPSSGNCLRFIQNGKHFIRKSI